MSFALTVGSLEPVETMMIVFGLRLRSQLGIFVHLNRGLYTIDYYFLIGLTFYKTLIK
jgi:hypothetical protein